MKNLNVPYLSQNDNSINPSGACNVTSIAMCLKYFGIVGDGSRPQLEDQVYQRSLSLGVSRHTPEGIKAIVESYPGMVDIMTRTGSLNDIKKAIDNGQPCIVHGYFTGFGHIIVIRGYDDNGFFVNDPYGEWYSPGVYHFSSGENLHYSKLLIATHCNLWSQGQAIDAYNSRDISTLNLREIWLHQIYRK